MFSLLPTRLAAPFSSILMRHSISALQCATSRYICERSLLKLDDYEQERKRFSLRLKDKDDFWLRIMTLQDTGHVFDEDLKMAWILAEEEHLPLVKNVSEIFLKTEKGVTFGSFRYGAVMMRACYFLNKPDIALEIFNNTLLRKWMDEAMSIIILMDLLIERGDPKEAVNVFEQVRQLEWFFVFRNPLVSLLYAIALYKMETNEALEKAQEFSKKLIIAQQHRAKVDNICGALALKLQHPKAALSFVSKRAAQCEVSWNIKIQAHIMLSEWENLVKEIKHKKQHCIYEDTREQITSVNVLNNKYLQFTSDNRKRSVDQVVTAITFEEYKETMPLRKKKLYS